MDIADLGFKVHTDGIDAGVDSLDDLDAAGNRVEKTSKGVTSSLTSLRNIAVTLGFAALAGEASAYVGSLAEVSTLVDTTTFDMGALSKEALNQSRQFGAMPTENVNGFYQAISAGADSAEKATDALTAANKLAIGGVTDTGTAIDGLTSAYNAYGGEAGNFTDISDAMFVAVKAGKTTIGELSASIGQLAPISSQAGGSLDEMLAAAAALTKGGVSTSVSMNGLRAMLATVIKPTKETAEYAKEIGLEFNVAAIESKGFAGFLEDVAEKTGGSSEKLGKLFTGVEALTPALALTGSASGDFATILEGMKNKAGETEAAFDKMSNSPGFQMGRIVASLSAEFLSFGSTLAQQAVPALRFVADGIPIVADGLRELAQFIEPVIPYATDFAVALGSVFVASQSLTLVSAIIGGIGAAATLLASPVVIIAGLATAAVSIYRNWDGFTAWWGTLWGGVQDTAARFMTWWNGTTLEEKTTDVATLGVDLAHGVAERFFIWWDSSTLREHTPQVAVDAIDSAAARARQFFDWWGSTTMGEKSAIVSAAVDQAKATVTAFVRDFWDKPLSERIANISTSGIDIAERAVKGFYDLWDTTLKQHAPQIVLDGVEAARSKISGFFDWWSATTFKEKVASVETSAIESARSAVTRLSELWNGSQLREKTPKIVTTAIDKALELAGKFVELWDEYKPHSWALSVVTDGLEKAKTLAAGFGDWWRNTTFDEKIATIKTAGINAANSAIELFHDYWETTLRPITPVFIVDSIESALSFFSEFSAWWDKPLKEKVADITFTALQSMWDLGRSVHEWWTNLKFEDKDPGILESVIGGVADGFSEFIDNNNIGERLANWIRQAGVDAVAAVKRLATDLVDGLRDGLASKAAELKASIGDMFKDIPLIGRAFVDDAEQLGVDMAEGTAVGMSKSDAPGQASEQMVDSIWGRFKKKAGIESPSRLMAALGLNLAEGVAVGLDSGGSLIGEAAERAAARADAAAERILNGLEVQFRKLTDSKDSARAYELSMQRITGANASAIIAGENLVESLREQKKAIGEFSNGLVDAVFSADSFRGAASATADYLKGWLSDRVKDFAKEKITAYLTVAGGDEAQGLLGGVLGGLKNMLGDFGGTVSGLFSGIGSKLSNALGSSGNLLSGVISKFTGGASGLAGAATAATSNIGGLAGVMGASSSTAAAATTSISGMVSSMAATAAPLAAVVAGGALWINTLQGLFSGYKKSAEGFELTIENGGIFGESVEVFKKKSVLFKNKYKEVMGELSTEIENEVTTYFTTMSDTITGQAAALGVDGADSILDSFSVATQRFIGANAEQELQAWLETSTRSAYRLAFERLGPELQSLLSESISIEDSTAEEIAAAFDSVAANFTAVTDAAELLHLQFNLVGDGAIVAANDLVEISGGLAAFNASNSTYFNEFFSAAERQQITLANTATEVAAYNVSLGLSGDAVIDNKEAFRAHVESMDLSTAAGREAYAAAMDVAGSMAAFAAEGQPLQAVIDSLPEHLRSGFETMQADAIAAANELERQSARNVENAGLMGGDLEAIAAATNADLIERWQLGAHDIVSTVNAANDDMTLSVINAQGEIVSTVTVSQAEMHSVIAGGAGEIVNTWGQTTGQLLSTLDDDGANMTLAMATATGDMVSSLTLGAGDMLGLVEGLGADMVALTGYTADSLVQITTESGQTMMGTWQATGDEVIRIVTANGAMVQGQFQSMSDGVITIVDSTGTTVSGSLANSGNNWISIVNDAGQTMTGTLSNAGSSMVSVIDSAAGGIANAANSTGNSLNNLGGNLGGVGNAAVSAGNAANSAARAFGSAADRAKAAMQNFNGSSSGGADGSLSVGSDYIPFDGFRAVLHEGEFVANAGLSEQIRAAGFSNSGTNSAPAKSPTLVPVSASNDGEATRALQAINSQLQSLRREQSAQAATTAAYLADVADESRQQTDAVAKLKHENRLLRRTLGSTNAA